MESWKVTIHQGNSWSASYLIAHVVDVPTLWSDDGKLSSNNQDSETHLITSIMLAG